MIQWIKLLKTKLGSETNITVTDARLEGLDKYGLDPERLDLAQRRQWHREYSDFIAVLTTNYVESCGSETLHELMPWALSLEDGENFPTRLWAVQVQGVAPARFGYRRNNVGYRTWTSPQWHLLPSKPADYLNIESDYKIDTRTSQTCIEPIDDHDNDDNPNKCGVCPKV